ncbi:MAG: 3-phosphoshikimate 1-carboxyvinyltransferase [Fusobacterium sp.]|uniref:3-phosphoshikimate 1-carboxyvinyltransferase n=1 Tax=Fusobacterium sp. TaxID=68766 RepID=UPI0026DB8A28|nr:3-phosphoshikimate 1-carboxyvinyltransferase [Fusobacterium sp.]MDO4689773.1 3-phosphoshikimate 1-carboxyvinyltransferase [Fusobacterium sp.]
MKKIVLEKSKLKGKVFPPASKSILHRYIIAASMADGKSRIKNISLSEDIFATISAMRNLGAKIEIVNRELLIDGSSFSNEKVVDINESVQIDCNESGSTLRFLIPISMTKKNKIIFKGKSSLFKRPLEPYFEIFEKNSIEYKFLKNQEGKLSIEGLLKSGEYEIIGNVSSQFITGLLFALPLLEGDSLIKIKGNLESKSYIDLTLDCLKKFGISFKNIDYKEIYIGGSQKYNAIDIDVEADFSQAAFFLVANELGSGIEIKNININSLQGDKEIIALIEKLKTKNKEILIDGSNCPDIIPIFSLYAAYLNKKVKIINVRRLRIKECDRLSATVQELSKLGFDLQEREEEILINYMGNKDLKKENQKLSSHNDHRIAMMIAIASTVYEGKIELDNATCVNKSYPDFWDIFSYLGGIYNECMGK